MKNELNEILDKLRNRASKNTLFSTEPEKECKHVLQQDEPILQHKFKPSYSTHLSQLEMEYNFLVKGYKCVNCGGDFVMGKHKKNAYPLIYNALGQVSLGEQIDANQCPILAIANNDKIKSYSNLFKNQSGILYLRAVTKLGEEATSIEILKLMEKLNNDDNKKLDAVYKDTENQIKNVTFGL